MFIYQRVDPEISDTNPSPRCGPPVSSHTSTFPGRNLLLYCNPHRVGLGALGHCHKPVKVWKWLRHRTFVPIRIIQCAVSHMFVASFFWFLPSGPLVNVYIPLENIFDFQWVNNYGTMAIVNSYVRYVSVSHPPNMKVIFQPALQWCHGARG